MEHQSYVQSAKIHHFLSPDQGPGNACFCVLAGRKHWAEWLEFLSSFSSSDFIMWVLLAEWREIKWIEIDFAQCPYMCINEVQIQFDSQQNIKFLNLM